MFDKLIASRLITPPAIWGKLPGYADFVRSGMRHGQSEGWQSWLARHGGGMGGVPATAALPAAFVLPPGMLDFAPRRFVIGVIAPSNDKVGRRHPLLVYHLAHRRWIEPHFEAQATQPRDWLFWLARAVARHVRPHEAAEAGLLERTVRALWALHAPHWRALWRDDRAPRADAQGRDPADVGAVLDRFAGAAGPDDPAAGLRGVRYLPWADWPQRLCNARGEGAFWQQDALGGFVNAATRLPVMWSPSP